MSYYRQGSVFGKESPVFSLDFPGLPCKMSSEKEKRECRKRRKREFFLLQNATLFHFAVFLLPSGVFFFLNFNFQFSGTFFLFSSSFFLSAFILAAACYIDIRDCRQAAAPFFLPEGRGGKSGLHRAGSPPSRRMPRTRFRGKESATENIPPVSAGKGEMAV